MTSFSQLGLSVHQGRAQRVIRGHYTVNLGNHQGFVESYHIWESALVQIFKLKTVLNTKIITTSIKLTSIFKWPSNDTGMKQTLAAIHDGLREYSDSFTAVIARFRVEEKVSSGNQWWSQK